MQRVLTTVRQINVACEENRNARAQGVYGDTPTMPRLRVCQARSVWVTEQQEVSYYAARLSRTW